MKSTPSVNRDILSQRSLTKLRRSNRTLVDSTLLLYYRYYTTKSNDR